jgi:hypothetical protein
MISDSDTAKQISELILEVFHRVEDSCEFVSHVCPPEEAAAYRDAADRVIQSIVLDVLEPLYGRHPELQPPHWDEDPADEPTM